MVVKKHRVEHESLVLQRIFKRNVAVVVSKHGWHRMNCSYLSVFFPQDVLIR